MIQGMPLLKEVEEFTPPDITKTMQEVRGGAFVPSEVMVGLEKMTASYKLNGATKEHLSSVGLTAGDSPQIDVRESHQDEDGEIFAVHYSLTGEITSVKEAPSKMGDLPAHTLEQSVSAYQKTENGKTCYDIDTKANILDLGNGDIMEKHRRNVGMP
jgi:P2 family phage contractile tail tube protein